MTSNTPPPSTLSTPSPTERDLWNPNDPPPHSQQTMPALVPKLKPKPIHLIVATALQPPLGIGLNGTLPWPPLKPDMAFFRRATTGGGGGGPSSSPPVVTTPPRHRMNAVIMGRKTYESIPARFRPLTGRVNVVLTRGEMGALAERVAAELGGGRVVVVSDGDDDHDDARVEGEVVRVVDPEERAQVVVTDTLARAVEVDAERVFCIGGAEVYGMVLGDPRVRGRVRVLQTRVRRSGGDGRGEGFECDTFWPEEMKDGVNGWRQVAREVVEEWAGVELPQGTEEWRRDEKSGTEIQVVGWEQVEKEGGGV